MQLEIIATICLGVAIAILIVLFGGIFLYGAIHLGRLVHKATYLIERNYDREIANESDEVSDKFLAHAKHQKLVKLMEDKEGYFDPEEHLPFPMLEASKVIPDIHIDDL